MVQCFYTGVVQELARFAGSMTSLTAALRQDELPACHRLVADLIAGGIALVDEAGLLAQQAGKSTFENTALRLLSGQTTRLRGLRFVTVVGIILGDSEAVAGAIQTTMVGAEPVLSFAAQQALLAMAEGSKE